MDPLSDVDLVRRARSGSRDAFAVLVSRHRAMAERVCLRVSAVPAPDLLHDVLQEAVLQAWLSLDRLRDPRHFGPWLTGITLNVARTTARQARNAPISFDDLVGGRL